MFNNRILVMLSVAVVVLLSFAELQYESSLELGASQAGGDKSIILADLNARISDIDKVSKDTSDPSVKSSLQLARTNLRASRNAILRSNNTSIDSLGKASAELTSAVNRLNDTGQGGAPRIDAIISDPNNKKGVMDIAVRVGQLPQNQGGGTGIAANTTSSGGKPGAGSGGSSAGPSGSDCAKNAGKNYATGATAIACSNSGGGRCADQDTAANDCRVYSDGGLNTTSPLLQCLVGQQNQCLEAQCKGPGQHIVRINTSNNNLAQNNTPDGIDTLISHLAAIIGHPVQPAPLQTFQLATPPPGGWVLTTIAPGSYTNPAPIGAPGGPGTGGYQIQSTGGGNTTTLEKCVDDSGKEVAQPINSLSDCLNAETSPLGNSSRKDSCYVGNSYGPPATDPNSGKTCGTVFNALNSCIGNYQNNTSKGSCLRVGFGLTGVAQICANANPELGAGQGGPVGGSIPDSPTQAQCDAVCGTTGK